MAQETSRAIFLRASQNAESMELPTSASVTEMLAGLGIQADVTEVESAFDQLALSPTSMLDAEMFARVASSVEQLTTAPDSASSVGSAAFERVASSVQQLTPAPSSVASVGSAAASPNSGGIVASLRILLVQAEHVAPGAAGRRQAFDRVRGILGTQISDIAKIVPERRGGGVHIGLCSVEHVDQIVAALGVLGTVTRLTRDEHANRVQNDSFLRVQRQRQALQILGAADAASVASSLLAMYGSGGGQSSRRRVASHLAELVTVGQRISANANRSGTGDVLRNQEDDADGGLDADA